MRDGADNVVIVCSIENIDPMGVHTGDSVTVAPQQTLTDRLYQKLRDQAIAVIRAVGVETGGSNVQFAVNPVTEEIIVIEMNPRVSRSSALASKATGFPIAKIAARLAVGYTLDEIPNDITRRTPASFEPALDYVVVKWPRFAFEKFPGVDATLSTHMKSVGEVMAIGRTFRQAFAKAMRSRELDAPAQAGTPTEALLDGDRDARRRPLRPDPRAARPRRQRRRRSAPAPASTRGTCASSRCSPPRAPARRRRAHVPRGRHLRRRVRGRDAVLLLGLGARRARARGRPRRQAERDDPRLGPEPDRPGDRVRLLLRARRDDRARVGPRRGDGQLQPRDGLDRLRHLRPPVLRAADARGRARDRRGRAARGRDRPVRRPDAAQARRRARARRACRCSAPSPTRSTWPRTAAASATCWASSACKAPPYATAHSWRGGAGRRRRASATRCSCARATCSAAARWRSSTRPTGCATTCAASATATSSCASIPTPRRTAAPPGAPSSSTASSRTRSRSTSTRSATARTSGSAGSCSTSRRPASTRATRPACCRRTRSATRCSTRSGGPRDDIALALGTVGLINVQYGVLGEDLYVIEANPRASRTVPFVSKATGLPLAKLACRVMLGETLADLGAARTRSARRPRLGQGGGAAVRPLRRRRRAARPGDALDRRGDGRRRRLPGRVRQGAGRRRRAAAVGRHGVPHGDRLRQGGRRRASPRSCTTSASRSSPRAAPPPRSRGWGSRSTRISQAGGGLAERGRADRARRRRPRDQHADRHRGALGRIRDPPRRRRARQSPASRPSREGWPRRARSPPTG